MRGNRDFEFELQDSEAQIYFGVPFVNLTAKQRSS